MSRQGGTGCSGRGVSFIIVGTNSIRASLIAGSGRSPDLPVGTNSIRAEFTITVVVGTLRAMSLQQSLKLQNRDSDHLKWFFRVIVEVEHKAP